MPGQGPIRSGLAAWPNVAPSSSAQRWKAEVYRSNAGVPTLNWVSSSPSSTPRRVVCRVRLWSALNDSSASACELFHSPSEPATIGKDRPKTIWRPVAAANSCTWSHRPPSRHGRSSSAGQRSPGPIRYTTSLSRLPPIRSTAGASCDASIRSLGDARSSSRMEALGPHPSGRAPAVGGHQSRVNEANCGGISPRGVSATCTGTRSTEGGGGGGGERHSPQFRSAWGAPPATLSFSQHREPDGSHSNAAQFWSARQAAQQSDCVGSTWKRLPIEPLPAPKPSRTEQLQTSAASTDMPDRISFHPF